MKALKKICTALMILAFAFVFASCSNGSDSDDDDSSTNVLLPSSVGENVLAGKSYKYTKDTKTTTYKFKDNTVTKTKVDSSETEIWEYKYTYNANTGLLSLNLVSVTFDGKKMTSMDDIYSSFEEDGMTEEEAKEVIGDDDMFKEITSMCYFVKANGNILLGNYFANEKDVKYSKFVCDAAIEADFDDGTIEVYNVDSWDIELNATKKTFSGAEIAGSYTVEKATKTLKDLNGADGLNQANGYITIKFSTLPDTLETPPYSMTTGTEYKFIFDLDCNRYTKL
ncbi:MAG: hypothetical protein MR694_02835 [Spirochaetia bacterium]|nr:hypothetical protein [Spirochaetia bacterium]